MTSECNFFGSPIFFCFRLHLKIPKLGNSSRGRHERYRIKILKFFVPVSIGQEWARDGTGQSRDTLSPSRLSHEYLSRFRPSLVPGTEQISEVGCQPVKNFWVPMGTGFQFMPTAGCHIQGSLHY